MTTILPFRSAPHWPDVLRKADNNPQDAEQPPAGATPRPAGGSGLFDSLNRMNEETARSRKDAAKARMAQLKAQLDNLLKFAGIGKGNPRLVAQLARELKALVSQYGGAAGSPAAQSGTPQGAAQSMVGAQAAPANSAQSGQQASETADSASLVTSAAQTAGTSPAGGTDKAGEDAGQPADAPLATGGQAQRNGGLSGEDQAFLDEARELAQKIKALLAQEIRKKQAETSDRDERDARAAIADMEQTIKDSETALAGSGMASVASAGYDASGGLTISVQASFSASA
ncbi:hypothetical protein [Chitinilyticum litopenaei]|uniref:hypothetical protein n=1 Tax=Chitinilyticum litopenaei TaxID=1121276 RepID=UPI000401592C|nr:hypothetical protein [Chitinilyticum litopenaei]